MGNSLLVQIEQYREKMISLTQSNDFTSDEVLQTSQHLDQLLNLYFKCSQEDLQSCECEQQDD